MKNIELAQKYQKNRRMRKAAEYWVAALTDAPDDEYALRNLLACQRTIGDFSNAQQTAKKLVQCNNMSDDNVISLADYYSDIGQPGIAFDYFRSIKNDSHLYLHSLLGSSLCNIRMKRLSDATEYVKLAKEVPVQFPEEYVEWSNVYLLLKEYRNSAISWFKAAAHADSFIGRLYALSSLLSLPLLAMSEYSKNLYLGIMLGYGLLIMLLVPPWSLVLVFLILPLILGGFVRNLLIGRTEGIIALLAMMLTVFVAAFYDF